MGCSGSKQADAVGTAFYSLPFAIVAISCEERK
jgi:hypothetical protein